MTLTKPVILCGFMASGKTTIGRLTAQKLHVPFYDTDELIVNRTGLRIPEIFDRYGESGFRDIEHDVARSIADLSGCVISTGGGMLTFSRNGEILHSIGSIVLLYRDFDVTWKYLSSCTDRPMVLNKTKEEIRALYDARIPKYQQYAHFILENNASPKVCAEHLIARLRDR